jgi:hypothetical protein
LDDLHYRSPSSKHYPYQRRFGDLASLSTRDNDVAERALAQPGQPNHE